LRSTSQSSFHSMLSQCSTDCGGEANNFYRLLDADPEMRMLIYWFLSRCCASRGLPSLCLWTSLCWTLSMLVCIQVHFYIPPCTYQHRFVYLDFWTCIHEQASLGYSCYSSFCLYLQVYFMYCVNCFLYTIKTFVINHNFTFERRETSSRQLNKYIERHHWSDTSILQATIHVMMTSRFGLS
jgi:hypothetical protein